MPRSIPEQPPSRLSPPAMVLRSFIRFIRQCTEMQIKVDNYY